MALLWVEQARKGAAETWTRWRCDPERAPAELQLKSPGFQKGISGGGTLRAKFATRTVCRCPLPSLFNPLRRPSHPSLIDSAHYLNHLCLPCRTPSLPTTKPRRHHNNATCAGARMVPKSPTPIYQQTSRSLLKQTKHRTKQTHRSAKTASQSSLVLNKS